MPAAMSRGQGGSHGSDGSRGSIGSIGDDLRWMERALELSLRCPPVPGAYSVGAIVVDGNGARVASGYSRESDSEVHAEECALAKIADGGQADLAGATMYSTLEPCSQRRSRPRTCTQLIIEAGIRRVVIAWREPSALVADCQGVERLTDAGIVVVELRDLAAAVREINGHIAGI